MTDELAPADTGADEVVGRMRGLRAHIGRLGGGLCSCGTKTPNVFFHDPGCGVQSIAICLDNLDVVENRLTALQAERDRLRAELERWQKIDKGCQSYWVVDADGEASSDPEEVVWSVYDQAYGAECLDGTIVEVARGGRVEIMYCAMLPPADDTDDRFWVEEATEEAARLKIEAELARRAAIKTED